MRRALSSLLLLLLSSGVLAEPVIEDLQISRDGEVVNIRATVRNTGTRTEAGPFELAIFARAEGASDWVPVQTWNDLPRLAAGHRVSRDFFSEDGDPVWALAANGGAFQVRATLTGDGLSEAVEKDAEHEHNH